jgi:hypothetical protein
MKSRLVNLTFEVELQPGEKFVLPEELERLGVGRWIITVQPALSKSSTNSLLLNHDAFLDSYAPEDEGLYDDDPPGFTPAPVTASLYDAFLDSFGPEDEGLYDDDPAR